MSNPQKNEIEQFKRDINLLQDKLKQLKKQSFLPNRQNRIAKTKNGSKWIAKNKMQNETKQIKRKIDLLQYRLEQFKKRQSLLEKGLKQIGIFHKSN